MKNAEKTQVKKKLVAVTHILFEAHQYKPGDELPAHNLEMNKAWIEAKTAKWVEEKIETTKTAILKGDNKSEL